MKLTILAIMTLALGVVLGLALHGQIDGSAVAAPPCPPKCATPTATPTLTATPTPTDRALVVPSPELSTTHLIDTDDGSLVMEFPNAYPLATSCDGQKALLNYGWKEVRPINAVDGATIASFNGPAGYQVQFAGLSCQHVSALASGLAITKTRAVIEYYDGGRFVQIIDTESGGVIATHSGQGSTQGHFNCLGDRVWIQGVGVLNTLTGAKVYDAYGGSEATKFLCGQW